MNTCEINEECPVCYEEIGSNNACVTNCGHKFCLNCLLQSYNSQNRCPLCREMLDANKKSEENHEYDNEYDDDEYDEDDDDDDEDTLNSETDHDRDGNDEDDDQDDDDDNDSNQTIDINKVASIEKITEELKNNGFTMEDMVSMYLDRPLTKYTRSLRVDGKVVFFEVDIEYQIKRTLLDKIIDDLDYNTKCEFEETVLMELEDDNVIHSSNRIVDQNI